MLCLKDDTDNILREHHANLRRGDEETRIIKTDIDSQLALVPESFQPLLTPGDTL